MSNTETVDIKYQDLLRVVLMSFSDSELCGYTGIYTDLTDRITNNGNVIPAVAKVLKAHDITVTTIRHSSLNKNMAVWLTNADNVTVVIYISEDMRDDLSPLINVIEATVEKDTPKKFWQFWK